MIVKIKPQIVPYAKMIQELCKTPYHGHSKGCPNFGKKIGCPPGLPLINKILDFNKDLYLIYTEFVVGEFAEGIRQKHPEWKNPRQWYNPRYWQPRARKYHRAEAQKAMDKFSLIKLVRCPEAHGVNVTGLMENVGITLNWEWPPKHEENSYLRNKVYLVSLAGYPVE